MRELLKFKDIHGRIAYRDKYGRINIWFGFIREVTDNYVLFQDNEIKHQFKVAKVIGFTPVKLPEWKSC